MQTDMDPKPQIAPPPGIWLLNPWLHLAAGAVLVAAAEVLLKKAAITTAQSTLPEWTSTLGLGSLGTLWEWAAIACYIASFFTWLHVLRFIPLSLAFALAAVSQALVPVGAWLFLDESVGTPRWCGIALIIAGIAVIAEPLMHAEETL